LKSPKRAIILAEIPVPTAVVSSPAPRRGRPRKFTTAARPITVTLPDRVIDALAAFDPDVSRAIVRLAQPLVAGQPHPPAELATFGRRSLIVVNPSRTLEQRTGVDLLHLPDGRALIAFGEATTISALELLIEDALDDPRLPPEDREIFETIGGILKTSRRSKDLTLLQRSVIVVEARRAAAAARQPVRRSRRNGRMRS
jgi:hypothetical protein